MTALFRSEIIITTILVIAEAALKLFNSICLNMCLEGILEGDMKSAYSWGGGVVVSLFVSSTCRHQGWLHGQNIMNRSRLLFVNTIYKKINKLSAYSIKEANLGKVINLISSDLNSTELKGFFLFNMLVAPLVFIGTLAILYFRLGPYGNPFTPSPSPHLPLPPGLLSVALLCFAFPLQNYLGKFAAGHVNQRSQLSDKRVKLINEAVEGIRLIKMYGWESAFSTLVQSFRINEVSTGIRASNYQQIEKAISKCFVLLVAAIVFLIVHYTQSHPLNSAKIFSTIEILQYIRTNVIMFSGMGIGYLFELKIFFSRLMDILNIEEAVVDQSAGIITTASPHLEPNQAAKFEDYTAYWAKHKSTATPSPTASDPPIKPVLHNINLTINTG